VINFFNASSVYLGGYESTYITTINSWKQASAQGVAPANTAYVRMEFRLYGPGTLWSDDALLTTGSLTPTPAPTPIPTPAPTPTTVSANMAPNSGFELDPNTDYYTNGTAAFTWGTDSYHGGTHSIKIVSTQAAGVMTRWMSRTTKIAVTPGKTYAASAWMKASVAGKANFVMNFWNASSVYISGVESTFVNTANTWTQASTQGVAPANAAYARLEFRIVGPGTLWSDDVNMSVK
jgi:hypothetical protein